MRARNLSPTLAAAAALLPLVAGAVDGVVEINHTCAVAGRCWPSDEPGYPVHIDGSAGTSYRLTSDLVVPAGNASAIWIDAPHVDLDLNGFAVIGAGCVGATADCTPTAAGATGIRTIDSPPNVSVRNGSVIGMGAGGIGLLGDQHRVARVHARWNRLRGISVGTNAIVADCIVQGSGDAGIWAHTLAQIRGNTVLDSGGAGILVQDQSLIEGNTVRGSTGEGIAANGAGSVIRGNTVRFSETNGIRTTLAGLISGNTVSSNDGSGIVTTNHSNLVVGNVVSVNAQAALELSDDSVYRDNVVLTPSGSVVTVSGGIDGGGNVCNGSTSCP